jgi:hypothetical protein
MPNPTFPPAPNDLPDSHGYWWVHEYKREGCDVHDWSYIAEVSECYPTKNDEVYRDVGVTLNIEANDADTAGYKKVWLPVAVFVSQKKQDGIKVEFVKVKEADPFAARQCTNFRMRIVPPGYKAKDRVRPPPDIPWSDTPQTRAQSHQRKIELLKELLEELQDGRA